MLKIAIAEVEEARKYIHISKMVMKVGPKVALIMSNGLFFNWKYYRSLYTPVYDNGMKVKIMLQMRL